jgi:hypothetical protein
MHAGPRGAALARSRTARQIDLSGRVVVFESLKKRRRGIFRAVPVPPELLDTLDMVHGIREAQRRGQVQALLWPWSRMTGFRRVQEVIAAAGIPDGPVRELPTTARTFKGAARLRRGFILQRRRDRDGDGRRRFPGRHRQAA